MFLLKCFLGNLSSCRNKRATVTELQNENEENVISYSHLRKSKIFKSNILNDCNLLFYHIITKNWAHIVKRWVYISRHCNYNTVLPPVQFLKRGKNKHWKRGSVQQTLTVKRRTDKHCALRIQSVQTHFCGWIIIIININFFYIGNHIKIFYKTFTLQ